MRGSDDTSGACWARSAGSPALPTSSRPGSASRSPTSRTRSSASSTQDWPRPATGGRWLATHGELDDVLDGLGGLALPPTRHPVRAVVFWVATVFLSPFLLLGTLLVLFETDVGDHVAGLVVVALAAAPLLGLWRWSRRS